MVSSKDRRTKSFHLIAQSGPMVKTENFPRYVLRHRPSLLQFLFLFLRFNFVSSVVQDHPKYESLPPTPENPNLPEHLEELPSASSRHDQGADEELLEDEDAESSSTSQSNREGRTKEAMDIDAPNAPEGAGDSTSPAAASPRALDANPASTESGPQVNSLGVPYVLS